MPTEEVVPLAEVKLCDRGDAILPLPATASTAERARAASEASVMSGAVIVSQWLPLAAAPLTPSLLG
jgi:hypothetical protein